MKIVVLSDTHGQHRRYPMLPDGDILIHCGDFTNVGETREVVDFSAWFRDQQHQHKLIIAGNHELGFRKRGATAKHFFEPALYLLDESASVAGLKFYGTPWCPWFGDWEWGLSDGDKGLGKIFDRIPDDTEVLITHTPPRGILDRVSGVVNWPNGSSVELGEDIGSKQLQRVLRDRLPKLKLHVFGHCHSSGGSTAVINGVRFVNAAMLGEDYSHLREPIVLEL